MTRVRWMGELLIYALFALMALSLMTPFHSGLMIYLVVLAPLVLVFVAIPAVRAGIQNIRSLAGYLSWWHWVVLIAVLSGLNFHADVRDVKDISANPLDLGTFVRIGLDAVVVLVLLVRLFNQQTPWLRQIFRGIFAPLACFAALSALSTMWSVQPSWTLYKSLEYGFDIVLAIALMMTMASIEDFRALFNWFWTIIGTLITVAWISALLNPAEGFNSGVANSLLLPQLSGVWPPQSANGLGTFGAMLGIMALGRLVLYPEAKNQSGWYKSILAFSIVTMIMADCRTAIAGFLLAVIVLLALTRKVMAGLLVGIAGALIAAFSSVGTTVWNFLLRGQNQQQFMTLTGRTEWWSLTWTFFQQRPLLGWGAFAGGRFVVMPRANHPDLADIDSSILEPLLDTGVLSLLLLLIALGLCWWYLMKGSRSFRLKLDESRLCVECLAVLTVVSFRAIFVSNLIRHPAMPFLLLIAFAEFVRRRLRHEV